MNEQIFKYIFTDFLLDPRYPKDFPESSDADAILNRLSRYFDIACERKAFNFTKSQYDRSAPHIYLNLSKKIVGEIFRLFEANHVFHIERHTFFGIKCSIDSDLFIEIVSEQRRLISIDDGINLGDQIRSWGVLRFKNGLRGIYERCGGFFDDAKWIDFYDDSMRPDPSEQMLEIPASDRLVYIDHNANMVEEIVKTADDLSEMLLSANDLGQMNSDQAKAAAIEVRQISSVFSATIIRADKIFMRSKETLSWIGREAAGAVVGAAALALLALIAAYLGFTL